MDPNQKAPSRMHYAMVLALVVSLVTSFLLGILLTQVMLGEGMKGIKKAAASTTRVQSSYAMPVSGDTFTAYVSSCNTNWSSCSKECSRIFAKRGLEQYWISCQNTCDVKFGQCIERIKAT